MKINFDSGFGLIYGQLVGDSLGGRYEFKSSKDVLQMIEKDIGNKIILQLLGEGPFNLYPGQVTDDSELALCILDVISIYHTYDKNEVAQRYIKWYNSSPFDIGQATSISLNNAKSYNDMINNTIRRDKEGKFPSMSNGSLMRISPIALLYYRGYTKSEILNFAEEDTRMTHSDNNVISATRLFVSLLVDILSGIFDKDILYKNCLSIESTSLIKKILMDVKGDTKTDPKEGSLLIDGTRTLADSTKMGYFGIALHNALYQLFNGRSYYQSIIDTLLLGGDTDTNCTICGALLGAYYGYNSIPSIWSSKIDNVTAYNIRNRTMVPPVQQNRTSIMLIDILN